jgi:hypothetical protein
MDGQKRRAEGTQTMITPEALAMSPALQQRIHDATREIAPVTFGHLPARQAEIQSSSLLTSDHWRAIRGQLARESGLVAVWFVDSLDLFLHAHGNWPKPSGVGIWYPSLVMFDTATAKPSDWLLAPWFASFKGVWAEMHGGEHVRFMPKRSIADADI